mgnify:CR=1 FL=1
MNITSCLKSFCLVAELGSFSRAAQCLHLSNMAISKQIQRLEDYWMSLRLSTLSIPAKHLLKNSISTSNSPTLSVALDTYFKMKGNGKSRVFYRAGHRNINAVIKLLGDRPIDEYSTSDASELRDHLIEKGLKVEHLSQGCFQRLKVSLT